MILFYRRVLQYLWKLWVQIHPPGWLFQALLVDRHPRQKTGESGAKWFRLHLYPKARSLWTMDGKGVHHGSQDNCLRVKVINSPVRQTYRVFFPQNLLKLNLDCDNLVFGGKNTSTLWVSLKPSRVKPIKIAKAPGGRESFVRLESNALIATRNSLLKED